MKQYTDQTAKTVNLPESWNKPVTLGKEFSGFTVSGNNTIWNASEKVLSLTEENGLWKGILPAGHKNLYKNGEMVLPSRWPENELISCEKWETKWDPEQNKWQINRLHSAIPEDVRKSCSKAVLNLYYAWENCRFREFSFGENCIDISGEKVPTSSKCKFYFEHVSEKYLTPGKWLAKPEEGIFYYKPLPGEILTETKFTTSGTETMLIIDGAENILFEHITFRENATDPLNNSKQADEFGAAAVVLRNAKNCTFRNCRFENLSRWGILIDDGCSGIRIEKCTLENLGSGAIRIQGNEKGKTPEFATKRNVIESCNIKNGGKIVASCTAILIKHSAENKILNTEISHFPYSGISCGWIWGYKPSLAYGNIVSGNHIHHLGEQNLVLDMGAIYMLGIQPGSVITDNIIHDVDGEHAVWGIYLDEGSSDILVSGNIVFRCKNAPFHVHYGKNNIVRNNLFVSGKYGACASVTRGTMNIQKEFIKGEKVFDFSENLCISNGMPFYLKYLLDIERKEEFIDSWSGSSNICIQLDPECKAKFADDFHLYERTYTVVPDEKFLADGRERGTQFFHGEMPSPEKLPEKLRNLYQKYLTVK